MQNSLMSEPPISYSVGIINLPPDMLPTGCRRTQEWSAIFNPLKLSFAAALMT